MTAKLYFCVPSPLKKLVLALQSLKMSCFYFTFCSWSYKTTNKVSAWRNFSPATAKYVSGKRALRLCTLLAATSHFSVIIGQKMQLTGLENANNMRNATCADTQTSKKWPYCSFLYCDTGLMTTWNGHEKIYAERRNLIWQATAIKIWDCPLEHTLTKSTTACTNFFHKIAIIVAISFYGCMFFTLVCGVHISTTSVFGV